MKISPKTLFLIDGVGALLTALSVGILLPRLTHVGIPTKNLYLLSVVALCFACYSLSCYFLVRKQASQYLIVIAVANMAYCSITIASLYAFAPYLSALAWAYFVGELGIVGALAYIELRTARTK